jgi:uncharacterized membrane protein
MTDKNYDLTRKIMSTVVTKEPRSKAYFVALDISLGILTGVSVVLAAYFTGYILEDVNEFLQALEPTDWLDLSLWQTMNLEIVPIVLIFLVVGVLVYRRTDWPLVRNSTLLLGVAFFGVLGTGVVMAKASSEAETSSYNWLGQALQNSPLQEHKRKSLSDFMERRNLYKAEVIKPDSSNKNYQIKFKANGRTQIIDCDPKECSDHRLQKTDGAKILIRLRSDQNGDSRPAGFYTPRKPDRQKMLRHMQSENQADSGHTDLKKNNPNSAKSD